MSNSEADLELSDALEQLHATREILHVLSRFPPALEPVFDSIVGSSARLCEANFAFVMLEDGGWLSLAARTECTEAFARYLDQGFAVSRATTTGRAALERAPVQVADFQNEPGVEVTAAHRRESVRTVLAVPMLQEGRVLGVIAVWRREVRPFTARQVDLMRTFADQAVIAVGNVRLFETVQARNTELASALAALQRETDAHRRSKATIRAMAGEADGSDSMLGAAPALQRVREQIAQVAPIDTTVLIEGETGTGKELVARAIHCASQRRHGPLIKLNCAAISHELVESELFGHEKGAFTGAVQQRQGRFELADRGTLFLDEVGEMRADVQAKLLRVLQDGEFERVGAVRTLSSDVRVIAATNRDLQAEVNAGRFRADLFYRLNVFPIAVPPLRERPDDIPALIDFFATRTARHIGRRYDGISAAFIERAVAYRWPGNVRELENLVERALVSHAGGVLDASALLPVEQACAHEGGSRETLKLADVESEHIRRVLATTHWRIEGERGAAALLGINPSTLRGRMRRFSIRKDP